MDTMDEVDALHGGAERIETPCGNGALVWRRWGSCSGRPVLLLHGGSGSWTHWVRNIEPLALAGCQVLVPDMPGFGESAAPPDGHDADVLPGWLERGLRSLLGDTPDLRRWDHLPGVAREAVHRHNLLQLMLAREASASALAVALHAANVERDRLRKRRLMLTDALVPVLAGLSCPVHGIWGSQDVLYRHRLPLIEQVLARSPGFVSLDLLPQAGHWVQFEAAEAFDAALAKALSMPNVSQRSETPSGTRAASSARRF